MFPRRSDHEHRIRTLETKVELMRGDLKEARERIFDLEMRAMIAEAARDQLRRKNGER